MYQHYVFSKFSPTNLPEHGLGHEPMARSQVQQTKSHHGRRLHEDGILHVDGTFGEQGREEYGENTGHRQVHAAASGIKRREGESSIYSGCYAEGKYLLPNLNLPPNSTQGLANLDPVCPVLVIHVHVYKNSWC